MHIETGVQRRLGDGGICARFRVVVHVRHDCRVHRHRFAHRLRPLDEELARLALPAFGQQIG